MNKFSNILQNIKNNQIQSSLTPPERMYIDIQIKFLKEQLSGSDYKVIKCSEYALKGKALPYDIDSLYEERQKVRDMINELEAKL